ncbi:WD repeat-containing protein 86-like protein, partial [Leptotrombidium deliense]
IKMGCAAVKGISEKKNNHLIDCIQVEHAITCLTLSEDNSLLVTGTDNGLAVMWSALSKSTELLGKLIGHEGAVVCCVVHESFVVTGSTDTTIRKWSIESGMCLCIYKGHSSKVNQILCFSCFMFSTSYDKTAKAWTFSLLDTYDANSTMCLRTLRGHKKSVYPIVFVPSENKPQLSPQIFERDLIITGSADCSVKIWSFVRGDCLKTLLDHTSPVQCLQLDPLEKKRIFSAGGDGLIICWDIITGEKIRELKGHQSAVLSLVAYKRMLYSASVDKTARAWISEFGECTRIYSGHFAPVAFVKYHNGLGLYALHSFH